jgi:hypothetical protein
MSREIVKTLTPEEEELLRKREELAGVRAALVERELELADFRAQLKSFEGRYLRQVGVLYAELDDWEARIAELDASLRPSAAATQRAQEAHSRAYRTHEATHGEASKAPDFRPSPDLKSLYRETAKQVHPDFAKDEADLLRRTRLMAQANVAYGRGDAEALKCILDEFSCLPESIEVEDVGAELVRIIRQIHQARKNIAAIEQEMNNLRASKIAQLRSDAETAQKNGEDLLKELAANIRARIARAKEAYQTLEVEAKNHDR